LFLYNTTATTAIYTLSLHDALPISLDTSGVASWPPLRGGAFSRRRSPSPRVAAGISPRQPRAASKRCITGSSITRRRSGKRSVRSEEHTSELQSRGHLVCRLLLEKK